MVTDRGQIHTLEAVIAALLIVGALLFASQATAVTPLSASTSNQHIENQQRAVGEDLLAIAYRNGTLTDAITYWNASLEDEDLPPHFIESRPNLSVYSSLYGTSNPLNESFTAALGHGIYAYNIDLRYVDEDGDLATTEFVSMGTPSDNAVTATRTLTLYESDETPAGSLGNETVEDHFWAPNINPERPVYNVVEVRLTIWRM